MSQRRIDVLSLLTFVAVGLPDGMLGTAWPAMRSSFHVPIGALGVILLVQTVGSVLATGLVSGAMRRIGVGAVLGAAAVTAAAAAAGYAVAPALAMVLSVAVLLGIASGSTDAGLNAVIGVSGRSRLLNLLHGAYGVGTAIGPLLVTAALLLGSWRGAYFVLVAVELAIAWQWFLHGRRESAKADRRTPLGVTDQVSPLPIPPVIAGIAVFFVYTGLEVAAGQWETTFDRNHLHMTATAAGIATFAYWGTLTAVRIALGLIPHPPRNDTVVRVGGGLSLAATAIIWLAPSVPAKVVGFIILGGALAGVFPALVALTPGRVGADHAGRVIAWQVGAAAAGGAGISAIIGLLIDAINLTVLGPALTALAVALILGTALLNRVAAVPLHSDQAVHQ
jgi:fucose permease